MKKEVTVYFSQIQIFFLEAHLPWNHRYVSRHIRPVRIANANGPGPGVIFYKGLKTSEVRGPYHWRGLYLNGDQGIFLLQDQVHLCSVG